ncbi:APC family permease [Streptomyces sp. NPDC001288]|uniref:APC family permease n=1 Tax=unclassified Streptomyces TaxID=2593676 RepID=UPI003331E936
MSKQPLPPYPPAPRAVLRPGTVGTFGIVFLVIAATAPLTALASNLSLSLGSDAGTSTLLVVLAVAALMGLFSVGYIAISKDVTNAGASYAFIGLGLGRVTGGAVACAAAAAYTLASGAMVVSSGYFLSVGTELVAGASVPWWAMSALIGALVAVLGYAGIENAKKLTVVIGLAEFAVLAALAVAVAVQRPHGYAPGHVLPSGFDIDGTAAALVFITLCFGGFEASAVYGEETRTDQDVSRAVRRSLVILTAVFFLATWSVIAAYADVHSAAAADPGTLVARAASDFLGGWAAPVVGAMTALSFTAAAVTYHHIASRYLFALGREGILPRRWARLNGRLVPAGAVTAQLGASAVVIGVPALLGLDPLTDFFPIVSGITSLALTAGFTLLCAGVIVASLRGRLTERSVLRTRVAPALAGTGFLTVTVLIVVNYGEVTGSDSVAVRLCPLLLPAAAAYGAWTTHRSRPARDARPLSRAGQGSRLP